MLKHIKNELKNRLELKDGETILMYMDDTTQNRLGMHKLLTYIHDLQNGCKHLYTLDSEQLTMICSQIMYIEYMADFYSEQLMRSMTEYFNIAHNLSIAKEFEIETAQTETAQTETAQTETAKEKTIKAVNNYLEYANGFDCHITPTKSVHSGKDGNAFEMLVKLALGNYRFNGIALKGRTDTTKKINGNMVKFEIKQGCSELGYINEKGEKHITVLDKDIIVYMPTYTTNMDINNSYVMTTSDFINLLAELNLIRYKKSTAMCKRPKSEQYKDRISIQSFTNSIKKETALYNALETNAIKLKDFIEQYGIKSIEL